MNNSLTGIGKKRSSFMLEIHHRVPVYIACERHIYKTATSCCWLSSDKRHLMPAFLILDFYTGWRWIMFQWMKFQKLSSSNNITYIWYSAKAGTCNWLLNFNSKCFTHDRTSENICKMQYVVCKMQHFSLLSPINVTLSNYLSSTSALWL